MIAIHNAEIPDDAVNVELAFRDEDGYIVWHMFDIPLIEIITCGECKYSKIYALQSDAPMKRWCHKGHFPKEVTDGYYCGDGERK